MHSFFTFISVIFFGITISSSVFAGELKSSKALTYQIKVDEFNANLIEGYHFNEKAPQQLEFFSKNKKSTVKANLLTKNEIHFKLTNSFEKAVASLYVCDDANTFCETHKINLTSQKNNSADNTVETPNKLLSDALKTAKKQNKFILLRFTARWCPGCVRYESEILPTNEFKKLTKKFIVTKVDVDLFENSKLSEQFKITGIPCLVFLNKNGEEIDRILDFKNMAQLQESIQTIEKNPTPAHLLSESLNKKDVDNLSLAKRLMATGHSSLAIDFLKKITPEPAELITAEVQLARETFEKDKATQENYKAVLKKALAKESNTSRSIIWRTELVGLLDSESKEVTSLVEEGKKIADELISNPKALAESLNNDSPGELVDYEKLAVVLEYIDLLSEAKKPTNEAFLLAAKIGQEYKIPTQPPGPARRYLIILNSAKKYAEAETYAETMLKDDPNNFDIQRRLMKTKLALNKPKEAIQIGEKILSESEGRNYFWVSESLTKAYLAMEMKEKAAALLKETLNKADINSPTLKELKSSLEELQKKSKPIKI